MICSFQDISEKKENFIAKKKKQTQHLVSYSFKYLKILLLNERIDFHFLTNEQSFIYKYL